MPFDFLSVLVVRGGAVCLPTPPSWYSSYINILIAILICEKSAANILSGKGLKLAFIIKSVRREGYLLLSLLFNIMLEVSSQQLNKNKTFKLEEIKLFVYIDNTILYVEILQSPHTKKSEN